MSEREHREWASLWQAVFGEPPPIAAEVTLTAQVLVAHLPIIEPYAPTADKPHTPKPRTPKPPRPPRSA